jgi:pyruvate dehydrogenase E2 component (dihydrolipoamide acetyltransferase)
MPVQILMPALSPTMTEGNLTKWLKKEGDKVKAGQVIAEIETDKATMEVEAVDEGTLAKIVVAAGTQGVKVNSLIAVLAEEGETLEDAAKAASKAPAAPKAAAASAAAPTAAPAAASVAAATASHGKERVFASPLARRLAEQKGVDLKKVKGSGPHGRIVRADVEGKGHASAAHAPVAQAAPVALEPGVQLDVLGQPYVALPNSGMRKVIAKRLTESKQQVPHFYLTVDCELDALLDLRKKMNDAAGTKISVNDFIIRAVALALKKVPAANVSWTDDAILQYKNVDISIAVATPTGLITPIIRQADSKGMAKISAEMKDLAARARDGKLKPAEFQGGGFSISNLGMFGVKQFAAIINPPQGCIFAVGAGEQRAVVKNGQLAIANVVTLTLSVDHRAVDGAVGAEFLQALKPLIENPYALVA